MSNNKRPSVKPNVAVKAAGKKVVAKKNVSGGMLEKYEGKLSKITTKKADPKTEFAVRIVAHAPVELLGRLLSADGNIFQVAHLKPRSSKNTVSLIKADDVMFFTGAVGENVKMTVIQRDVMFECKRARITIKGDSVVITNSATGDTTVFNNNNKQGFVLETSLAD
jgi:hypothetical protein